MAKPMLLSLSVCLLLLFHGCLARSRTAQYQDQNQCELNRLEAREPDHRVECEGGLLESWDPNHEQFECVGVALARFTIQPNSLHLPSYTNAPQLIHIIRGRGVLGTLFPGCPETFEEPQQGGSGGGQSSSQRDRHQHIRHIKEGDIVALPAGFAYWSYNDGDQPLVTVNFLDVSNNDNQLDLNPRRFYLAGNPHDEFNPRRVPQGQRGRLSEERQRRREEEKQQEGLPNNIFSGFSVRLIQESFNVDAETARRIQNQNDFRGSIIRVKDRLDLVRPPRSRQEQEHEMRRQELQQIEREHSRRQAERDNGVEETFCTMRLRENLGDPARADLFSPQAGRLTTVNSYNLPVLNWLQLSAERGFLYSNAMYSPHYNINAHSIIYAIRGRARVQVVDNFGRSVFEGELRQGQALTVPQNFALVKQAENEGFEWVSFKTNDRAKVHQLAGRISFIRAMPEDVIANAYQISREQARRLQHNRQEASLFTTSRQSGIRPVVTA